MRSALVRLGVRGVRRLRDCVRAPFTRVVDVFVAAVGDDVMNSGDSVIWNREGTASPLRCAWRVRPRLVGVPHDAPDAARFTADCCCSSCCCCE